MPTVNAKKKKAGSQDPSSRKNDAPANTFEGTLVSVTGDKLVMMSKEGKNYSHKLAKDAKITCDGKACKAEDLEAGSEIRVTTKKDDRNQATGIEARERNSSFSKWCD